MHHSNLELEEGKGVNRCKTLKDLRFVNFVFLFSSQVMYKLLHHSVTYMVLKISTTK